ncbi:MAG: c-type cytochrome [Chloroflexi bacterium]|nr:c-type cytochrome [Chloroflexota bacterium]
MHRARLIRHSWLVAPVSLVLALALWQAASVFADAPRPNPLAPVPPGNPIFAPVPGVDLSANGPAASIHGDPVRGRGLFAQNCATCHGERGTGGVPNPGSDDGTVPTPNPIDSEFLEEARGQAAVFARDLDLFVQHGSRPSGSNPQLSQYQNVTGTRGTTAGFAPGSPCLILRREDCRAAHPSFWFDPAVAARPGGAARSAPGGGAALPGPTHAAA